MSTNRIIGVKVWLRSKIVISRGTFAQSVSEIEELAYAACRMSTERSAPMPDSKTA